MDNIRQLVPSTMYCTLPRPSPASQADCPRFANKAAFFKMVTNTKHGKSDIFLENISIVQVLSFCVKSYSTDSDFMTIPFLNWKRLHEIRTSPLHLKDITLVMVNRVEWLWDPSDSFVICFCEPEGPQRSIAFQYFFILLTNKNDAIIYSDTICEQKKRIVHYQWASNINWSTVVFVVFILMFAAFHNRSTNYALI